MPTLSVITRKEIVQQIHDAVEQYSRDKYPSEHRSHLGASVVGDKCSRKSWYTFRWCRTEEHAGRMRRLLQRGHREEQIFIELLRGIGFKIWEHEPEILHYHPESGSYFLKKEFDPGDGLVNDVTGNEYHEAMAAKEGIKYKQFRIYGCEEHFGGSGDSKGVIPWLPDMPILLEFKTHNTKSFTYLVDKGLVLGKPQHYAQMCLYGKGYQYQYGLYCAINKNDDDYYFELIELDWNYAQQLENKAHDIIFSPIAPNRISDNPSYFDCKYCHFNPICHYNEAIDKNCRSCKMAKPVKNAEWYCEKWQAVIPQDEIIKGCTEHVSIND